MCTGACLYKYLTFIIYCDFYYFVNLYVLNNILKIGN